MGINVTIEPQNIYIEKEMWKEALAALNKLGRKVYKVWKQQTTLQDALHWHMYEADLDEWALSQGREDLLKVNAYLLDTYDYNDFIILWNTLGPFLNHEEAWDSDTGDDLFPHLIVRDDESTWAIGFHEDTGKVVNLKCKWEKE